MAGVAVHWNRTRGTWSSAGLIGHLVALGATPAELIQSIVTALASNAGSLAELRTLTNGKPYFDNHNTSYSGGLLPAAVLGDLRIPMLMLSNSRGPVAPGFNQASYAAILANGATNLLVQRQVPVYGHCVFTPAELGTAFTDLVLWVEYGIKPAP